jgi:hypothetical protein
MAEARIVQKAEADLVLMRGSVLTPTNEEEITLLPDCLEPFPRTKVGSVRGGYL